jgi:hypothetical protein
MNKKEQHLIMDQFINSHKGVNNFGANEFEINGVEFTSEAFDQRAKELGWINGYKWGVEYPTNGKTPDLPDDVLFQWKNSFAETGASFSGRLDWRIGKSMEVVKFRIVDERYKPKEPESLTKPDNSWHELGELPPVGVECEYKVERAKSFIKCFFIGSNSSGNLVIEAFGRYCTYKREQIKFRPIKTEREKFVEAAIKAVSNCRLWQMSNEDAAILYDAGFRAPD